MKIIETIGNLNKSKKKMPLTDKFTSCAYFGIFDCDCCKLENKLLVKKSQDVSNQIKKEFEMTGTKVLNINEPSTSSTDADIIDYDINFVKEKRKIKEYEEKFMKMINTESFCNLNTEDEEIDVVNDIPNTVSSSLVKTTEISPQTTQATIETQENENLEHDEEIDVVNLNQDAENQTILETTGTDFDENMPLALLVKKKPIIDSNFSRNENIKLQNDQNDEEIDVVSLPNQEFDEDAPLSSFIKRPLAENISIPRRKRKKSTRNNLEDEIIDVVNLTETPDFASLSNALVESNRCLNLTNKATIIDLINCSREDSVIEISDSPTPRIITEVITVEDDDSFQEKPTFGTCPVCFEDLSKCEIMSTMCGHVFCAHCIKTVIKTTKKCPKCRKHLTLKSVHPLFF